MKKIFLFATCSLLFLNCQKKNFLASNGNKLMKLKSVEYADVGFVKVAYYLFIPDNGNILAQRFQDINEMWAIYPDSSIIYLADDEWRGSSLNFSNLASQGVHSLNRRIVFDTLCHEGVQSNGRYWKQIILGQVALGYTNATPERKEAYDAALSSFRKKFVGKSY
jgi:hypothetical protein